MRTHEEKARRQRLGKEGGVSSNVLPSSCCLNHHTARSIAKLSLFDLDESVIMLVSVGRNLWAEEEGCGW